MYRATRTFCALGLLALVLSATAGRLAALVREEPTLLNDSPVLTLGETEESTTAEWLGSNPPPEGYTEQVVEFGTGDDVPEAYRGQKVTVYFQPPVVLGPPRPAPIIRPEFPPGGDPKIVVTFPKDPNDPRSMEVIYTFTFTRDGIIVHIEFRN